MHEAQDTQGEGYIIGTTGASKILMESLIDGSAVVLSIAVPAASPLIAMGATALKGVGAALGEHEAKNIKLMLAEGQKAAGLSEEDLLAALTSDPEKLIPFVQACDAARRSVLHQKVQALGRALSALATDDALVDDTATWIDIFSRVDAPHVRLISALFDLDPEHEGEPRLWKRYELKEKCGLTSTVNVLINTLTSLGLMREVPYEELTKHAKARWQVSPPGTGYSPVYGKGPLTSEFMERLEAGGVITGTILGEQN